MAKGTGLGLNIAGITAIIFTVIVVLILIQGARIIATGGDGNTTKALKIGAVVIIGLIVAGFGTWTVDKMKQFSQSTSNTILTPGNGSGKP